MSTTRRAALVVVALCAGAVGTIVPGDPVGAIPGWSEPAVSQLDGTPLPFEGPVAVSDDGRYVAFSSSSPDLVAGDTNGWSDTFVADTVARSVERVSIGTDGTESDAPSTGDVAISGDGRWVAFASTATNLTDDADAAGATGVFLRDRQAGTTSKVNVAPDGSTGTASQPAISDDGRYVAFVGEGAYVAGAYAPEPASAAGVLFVRDLQTGAYEVLNACPTAVPGEPELLPVPNSGDEASSPRISDDGNVVAFLSSHECLVANDANGVSDAFVHDRSSGLRTRVEPAGGGDPDGATGSLDLSGDGTTVALETTAGLVSNDLGVEPDLYTFTVAGPTIAKLPVLASGETSPVAISDNGRYVAFERLGQVKVHDRSTLTTARASILPDGSTGGFSGGGQFLAGGGSRVAFSAAGSQHLYLRNLNPTGLTEVRVGDALVREGDSANRLMTFTLTVATRSTQDISVTYTTVTGTATSADIKTKTAVAHIKAGQTAVPVTVDIRGDTVDELDETFTVKLTAVTGPGVLVDSTALGTIEDDDGDGAGSDVRVRLSDATIVEGDGGNRVVSLSVTLSQASTSEVFVTYTTQNGTATAGSDFVAKSGSGSLAPGNVSRKMSFVVRPDLLPEGATESFTVLLTSATSATIDRPIGTITLYNDD